MALPAVVQAHLRAGVVGTSAVQRARSLEAITRELVTVINVTVVNTETMCELLRKIAALGLAGSITRWFLPSYSPNLNLIERLWRMLNRRSVYGRDHPAFSPTSARPSSHPSPEHPPPTPINLPRRV